jgi:hypothetical protein
MPTEKEGRERRGDVKMMQLHTGAEHFGNVILRYSE